MYKVVITMDKREDMSYDEFEEYYFEEHAPYVEDIPKVQRFTVALPLDYDESEYDAVAELYFESPEDIEEGMGSDEAAEAVEDVANFGAPESGFNITVEEEVVFDKT